MHISDDIRRRSAMVFRVQPRVRPFQFEQIILNLSLDIADSIPIPRITCLDEKLRAGRLGLPEANYSNHHPWLNRNAARSAPSYDQLDPLATD
jgi:hypothetical protein